MPSAGTELALSGFVTRFGRTVRMESEQGLRFEDVVTVRRIMGVGAFLIAFSLAALGLSTAHGISVDRQTIGAPTTIAVTLQAR